MKTLFFSNDIILNFIKRVYVKRNIKYVLYGETIMVFIVSIRVVFISETTCQTGPLEGYDNAFRISKGATFHIKLNNV